MTLILTAVTKHTVVQVSDRRLTSGGSVRSENAIKGMCVVCTDSAFAIGYTGLATVYGGLSTDEWLFNHLSTFRVDDKSVVDIANEIRDHATRTFEMLRRTRDTIVLRTTFVLAGFRFDQPFVLTITNMEDQDGKLFRSAADEFRGYASLPKPRTVRRKSDLWAHGAEQALDELKSALRRVRERSFSSDDDRAARMLVGLVRSASKCDKAQTIGQDCLSVVVDPRVQFPFRCLDHSVAPCSSQSAFHLLTPTIAIKNISLDQVGNSTQSTVLGDAMIIPARPGSGASASPDGSLEFNVSFKMFLPGHPAVQ